MVERELGEITDFPAALHKCKHDIVVATRRKLGTTAIGKFAGERSCKPWLDSLAAERHARADRSTERIDVAAQGVVP